LIKYLPYDTLAEIIPHLMLGYMSDVESMCFLDERKIISDGDAMKFITDALERALATRYGLTSMELKVLRLLREDLTRGAIANRLNLSVHTIDTHLTNAYRKLGVKSAAGAVARISILQSEVRAMNAFC